MILVLLCYSALNKNRVKWTVLFHWLLFIVMVVRLSSHFCKFVQLEVPALIEELNLPACRMWELAWLPSIMASMFAQLSLKRNNTSLLWQALLGMYVLICQVILLDRRQASLVTDSQSILQLRVVEVKGGAERDTERDTERDGRVCGERESLRAFFLQFLVVV